MIVDYEYPFTKRFTQKWLSTSFFTKYTVSTPYSGSFSSQSPSINSPTLLLISSCNVHIKLVLFVQLHLYVLQAYSVIPDSFFSNYMMCWSRGLSINIFLKSRRVRCPAKFELRFNSLYLLINGIQCHFTQ